MLSVLERGCLGIRRVRQCTLLQRLDGIRGLEIVSRHGPALIELDLKKSVMRGSQLLELQRRACASLPVVIVTGYSDSDLMVQAMKHGPLLLLAKPVEPAQLETAVAVVLGQGLARRAA
jgi:DNA-binding NtrC family response regulator